MTTIDQFHEKIRRKVADLTPAIAAAYLAGLAELLALIERHRSLLLNGDVEGFIATVLTDANLDIVFALYRAALIDATRDAMRSAFRVIPGATSAQASALPNILDPRTIESIRQLDRLAMERIGEEIRAMVRAGYQQATTTREALAIIERSIGLGPSQVGEAMRHVEQLATTPPLTAAQVERSVTQFSARQIASNAANLARTSALMAVKRANALAWQAAQDMGILPEGSTVAKEWVQVQRPTKRANHALMDGIVVPLDARWPNGDFIPGDGDPWNCWCSARMSVVL